MPEHAHGGSLLETPVTGPARPNALRPGALILASAVVLAAGLLASRVGYIPMWDGRIYADCVTKLATSGFSVADLRCAEHTTHAYMLFAGIVQRLSPESYWPMLISSAVLYALAAVAFHRVARAAFPAEEHRTDAALLTCCLLAQPAILGSVVQPGIDLPLVPGFLAALLFAIERRWVLLVLAGTAMAFTKETGVLLYALLLAVYGLWVVLPGRPSGGSRVRAIVGLAPLALPVGLFAAYLLARLLGPDQTVIWAATPNPNDSLVGSFFVPRIDRRLAASLIVMLALSFAWVPAAFIGVDALVGAVRRWRREPGRPMPGTDRRTVVFLLALTGIVGLVLTRLAPYTNVRYALVFIALLPLAFYATLVRLGLSLTSRRAIVGAWAALLFISTVRTVDPVSRGLFGTFDFGDHRLLRMTRVTGECCGAGRDQLVYNLQFTALHDLMDDAIAAVPLPELAALVIPHRMTWFTVGPLDSATRRRTLRRSGTFEPRVLEPDSIAVTAPLPSSAWFLALPHGSAAEAVEALEPAYVVGRARTFERGGYVMQARPLTLRGGPPLRAGP